MRAQSPTEAGLGEHEPRFQPIGKFFQRTDLPSLHGNEPVLAHGGPLALRDLRLPAEVTRAFVEELM